MAFKIFCKKKKNGSLIISTDYLDVMNMTNNITWN